MVHLCLPQLFFETVDVTPNLLELLAVVHRHELNVTEYFPQIKLVRVHEHVWFRSARHGLREGEIHRILEIGICHIMAWELLVCTVTVRNNMHAPAPMDLEWLFPEIHFISRDLNQQHQQLRNHVSELELRAREFSERAGILE